MSNEETANPAPEAKKPAAAKKAAPAKKTPAAAKPAAKKPSAKKPAAKKAAELSANETVETPKTLTEPAKKKAASPAKKQAAVKPAAEKPVIEPTVNEITETPKTLTEPTIITPEVKNFTPPAQPDTNTKPTPTAETSPPARPVAPEVKKVNPPKPATSGCPYSGMGGGGSDYTRSAHAPSDEKDQGYFGPDSVTWKVFADPTLKLAGYTALTLQALNPAMMKLFMKATTSYSTDGNVYTGDREERTGQYFQTVAFGDKEHVDKAAETVRRLHAHAKYQDPRTGELLEADNPLYLAWTHNTFVWSIIRVMQEFGPGLTIQEVEKFVREQHTAARLIGIDETDRTLVPDTFAELDTWINDQQDWLAMGKDAAEASESLRNPKFTLNPKEALLQHISNSIFYIMPEWAAGLYGVKVNSKIKLSAVITRTALRGLTNDAKTPDFIKEALEEVETHPYRKTESDREK